MHKSRFSGARTAANADHRSGFEHEVDTLEHFERPPFVEELLFESFDANLDGG